MAPEVAVCETNKDNPYDSKVNINNCITVIKFAFVLGGYLECWDYPHRACRHESTSS